MLLEHMGRGRLDLDRIHKTVSGYGTVDIKTSYSSSNARLVVGDPIEPSHYPNSSIISRAPNLMGTLAGHRSFCAHNASTMGLVASARPSQDSQQRTSWCASNHTRIAGFSITSIDVAAFHS
jgi:hypothetical protein